MAGRIVLVTIGTSGIGRATAQGLATMGAHVVITGRDGVRTEDTAGEIRAVGGGLERTVALNHLAPFLPTNRLLVPGMRPFLKTPAHSAVTSIHLASAPHLDQETGKSPANSKPKRSSTRGSDEAVATRLWQDSADLVGPNRAGRRPQIREFT